MTTRTVEKTVELLSGFEMPTLGLGTWELTGERCEKVVKTALELGYTSFDSAEMYENETEIGRALKGHDRAGLFVTSKSRPTHLTRDGVKGACDASLKRLKMDYLDLYLIHWPNDEIPMYETFAGMQDLVQAEKVRSIGVSNFDLERLREAIQTSEIPICNNQIEYHPFTTRNKLPDFCREHQVVITAYCPLARGKVLKEPVLKQIGQETGRTSAQVTLRWLLQKGHVVIPKSSSREHLESNMDVYDWQLSEEQMSRIDGITRENRLVDNRYT